MPLLKRESTNNNIPTPFSYIDPNTASPDHINLVENISGIGFWKVDLRTGENYWSDQFYKICGLDPENNAPSTELRFSIIHPEDIDFLKNSEEICVKKGSPFQIELRIQWPSGAWRKIISEGAIEYTDDGNPSFLQGTYKDITQLRTNFSTKKSVQDEIGIFNYSIDLIFIFNKNGNILKVSNSVQEILGYSENILLKSNFFDFITPADYEKSKVVFGDVLNGNKVNNFKNRCIDSNGNTLYLNWTANLKKDNNEVVAIARDVTERVYLKKERSKEKFRIQAMLNTSKDLIWSVDKDFNLINANNAFIKSLKDSSGKNIKLGDSLLYNNLYSAEENEFWRVNYTKSLEGKVIKLDKKVNYLNEQEIYIYKIKIKPIIVEDEVVGLACFARDVTKKRILSNKIKTENKQLLKGQEISKIGYWESNLKTKELFWSDEMYRIWGIKKESVQISFEFFLESLHPDDRKNFLYHSSRALIQEKTLDIVYRINTGEDNYKFVHEKAELEEDNDGGVSFFRGTVQEVTKEKEIETTLRDRNLFIESTLNNLQLGICVNKISDGETTYMNKAFESIYGWPKSDLINIDLFFEKVYRNPEYRNWIKTKILDDIKSGDAKRMEWNGIMITTKDGKERIVNAKNIPVPDLNLMISTVYDDTDRYLAEQGLRVSNERFKLVSEAVSDAIWDWDLESNTVFLGQGFHRLFGYNEEENLVDGEIWCDNVHPEDYDAIYSSIEKAKADPTQKFWSERYRFKRRDGSYALVKAKTLIIRNNQRMPIRLVGALQDMTQENEREQEVELMNERFMLVSEATNDAIWDWDLKTNVHFWGEGFSKLFGVNISSSIDILKEWDARIHPDDKIRISEFVKALLKSDNESKFNIEYRFKKNDGSYAFVLDSGKLIRSSTGDPIRVVGAVQDISARKEYEHSLQVLNESLIKANKKLEISNQDLEQFAFVASHDLQEPLRMITSFLSLIEKRYQNVIDEKGKQYIHFAIDGAKRMREIILDLLEFSKLDNVQETKGWTDSRELVDIALLFMKKNIQKKGAIVHIENLPKVYGHKSTLIQLFQNLISNAIKYQVEDKKPEISISAKEYKSHWQFSIVDNGIGIEEAYLEKIFVIFQRLHTKGTYSGTGIGLAISKKIVEHHEGKVWAESKVNVGTTFHFTLKKPI